MQNGSCNQDANKAQILLIFHIPDAEAGSNARWFVVLLLILTPSLCCVRPAHHRSLGSFPVVRRNDFEYYFLDPDKKKLEFLIIRYTYSWMEYVFRKTKSWRLYDAKRKHTLINKVISDKLEYFRTLLTLYLTPNPNTRMEDFCNKNVGTYRVVSRSI